MPGTSPDGWPYILDDDHPLEYPAYSQSLATLMDSRWDTPQGQGFLTASTGWADFGGNYAGMAATRSGGIVTLEALLKRTAADVSITSSPTTVATIPAGFRPGHDLVLTAMAAISTGYGPVRMNISVAGLITIQASPAVTIPTSSGFVSVHATFAQGN